VYPSLRCFSNSVHGPVDRKQQQQQHLRHIFGQCIPDWNVFFKQCTRTRWPEAAAAATPQAYFRTVYTWLKCVFLTVYTDPLTGSSSSSNTLCIFSDSVSLIEMCFFNSVHGPVDRKQQQQQHLRHIFGQCIPDWNVFLTVYTDPLTGSSSSSSNTSDCLTKVVSERTPLSLGQSIPPAGRGYLCSKIAGRIVRKYQAYFSKW
jgi:hypothetical protein